MPSDLCKWQPVSVLVSVLMQTRANPEIIPAFSTKSTYWRPSKLWHKYYLDMFGFRLTGSYSGLSWFPKVPLLLVMWLQYNHQFAEKLPTQTRLLFSSHGLTIMTVNSQPQNQVLMLFNLTPVTRQGIQQKLLHCSRNSPTLLKRTFTTYYHILLTVNAMTNNHHNRRLKFAQN